MAEMKDTRPKRNLLDKAVDIDPTGVLYDIKGTVIENFVEEYLASMKIDGVEKVYLKVQNEGYTNPRVALYLFMSTNSSMIASSADNVPVALKNKMDKISIRLKDELKKALYPLCGSEIEAGKKDNRTCYVQLNVFRALGLMLKVDPAVQQIVISNARREGRDSVISVIKQIKYFGGKSTGNTDKYARMIDDIERH